MNRGMIRLALTLWDALCRGRWLYSCLALTAPSVLMLQCVAVSQAAPPCDNIQTLSWELTPQEVDVYCRYAARERQKVEAFWGPTWQQPIRIHVDRAYRISRALVPAALGNRGFMEMPLRHAREHTGALLHEIVHIYAPHDNRFLAEGLAVYL